MKRPIEHLDVEGKQSAREVEQSARDEEVRQTRETTMALREGRLKAVQRQEEIIEEKLAELRQAPRNQLNDEMNDEANNGFALLNEQRAQVEISSACIRALADVAHLSDINAVSDSYPLLKRHLELQLVEDEGYAEQIRAANNVEAAALYGVYADLLENQIVRSIEKQICTPVEAAEVNAELRNCMSKSSILYMKIAHAPQIADMHKAVVVGGPTKKKPESSAGAAAGLAVPEV